MPLELAEHEDRRTEEKVIELCSNGVRVPPVP